MHYKDYVTYTYPTLNFEGCMKPKSDERVLKIQQDKKFKHKNKLKKIRSLKKRWKDDRKDKNRIIEDLLWDDN